MENSQQSETLDPAAAAFARLESEVGVIRRLIAANDHSETLGEMSVHLDAITKAMRMLADRPAMQLTPDAMSAQIVTAGDKARQEDSATIAQARGRIDAVSRHLEMLIGTAATIRQQRQRLLWTAGSGALAGMLLWSVLPGAVARTMPTSWYWPERMAAHMLRLDRWGAGARLLGTANPDRWREIVLGNRVVRENRDAIAACLRTAAKKHESTRCTVSISSTSITP